MKKVFIAILILLMFTASALATVSDSTSRIKYGANGNTTTFDFFFGVNATGDIQVIYTDSAGAETVLIETTHYEITATNNDYSSGGTVTTDATYANGTYITIIRNVTIEQESDFTEGMPTLYEVFEDGLDDLTRVAQQLHEQAVRTPKLAVSSSYATTGYTFPDPEGGKVIGWNSGGTELTLFALASGDTIDVASSIEVIGDHGSNIATAVAAIGSSTETTLLIDVAAPGDTTVSKNIHLWFVGSGSLTGTVTINGPIDAGLFTIFTGDITLGAGAVDKYIPIKWCGAVGNGTTDDGAAFTKCSAAGKAAKLTIKLANKTYRVTATGLGASPDMIAIEGSGSSVIALSDEVVWNIYNGFGLKNFRIETTHVRDNSNASFIYLFTTTNSEELLDNLIIEDFYYGQTADETGANRGNSFLLAKHGIANTRITNAKLEGIRRGFIVEKLGASASIPMVDGLTVKGFYGKNMQTLLAPGSPSDGEDDFMWTSRGIVIDGISGVNTETQSGNYSGGARTGHSWILGSLGTGGKLSNFHAEWSIEHAFYIFGRDLNISNLSSLDAEAWQITGVAGDEADLSRNINVSNVNHVITEKQHNTSASIFSLFWVEDITTDNVSFRGTNNNDGSGGQEAAQSGVGITRQVNNLTVSNWSGQYLKNGLVSYATGSAWEETFNNITIRDNHVLDPTASTAGVGYAALMKQGTSYPSSGYSNGDALIKNVVIENNYFASTTETLGEAETQTPLSRGKGGTKMTGLVYMQDMRGLTLNNNTIDGWFGPTIPVKVDTAATGNRGYSTKLFINERWFARTDQILGNSLADIGVMSAGSYLELVGYPKTTSGIDYFGGFMRIHKGGTTAIGNEAMQDVTTQSNVEGEFTIVLDNNELISTALFLPNFYGIIEVSTDSGDHLSAWVNGAAAFVDIDTQGTISSTSATGNTLNIFRSGNDTVIDNNDTSETLTVTFRYRGGYN